MMIRQCYDYFHLELVPYSFHSPVCLDRVSKAVDEPSALSDGEYAALAEIALLAEEIENDSETFLDLLTTYVGKYVSLNAACEDNEIPTRTMRCWLDGTRHPGPGSRYIYWMLAAETADLPMLTPNTEPFKAIRRLAELAGLPADWFEGWLSVRLPSSDPTNRLTEAHREKLKHLENCLRELVAF